MKTREELEKLSLPDLLTFIEELERKVAAGEKLAGILTRWFELKGEEYPYLLSDALEAYRNAK